MVAFYEMATNYITETHSPFHFSFLGPALLAFTLMMCALSLRTWRRNGVACDELLFLPGTLHGHEHGVEGPLIEMPPSPPSPPNSQMIRQQSEPLPREEDILQQCRLRRTYSDEDVDLISEIPTSSPPAPLPKNASLTSAPSGENDTSDSDHETEEVSQTQAFLHPNNMEDEPGERNLVSRLRRKFSRLSRLGTFFFFRSTSASTQNAAYAPSGPIVLGGALDLSMPVLFNFHLFIEAYNHIDKDPTSELTAKILPVLFLSVLIVRTIIPPGRRSFFWGTLKFTFTAPLHRMRFRDGFIGDILTSWVRPGQDLCFALSYLCTVIYGTISGKYGLTASGNLLEESLLLHNVILPSFAILPLWLKYVQTLRQAYDTNKRWPYQLDSLKYLSATLVVIYGITHPEKRDSPWWILSFLLALLYQIWWDIFMDWELFEIQRDIQLIDSEQESCCARISSFQPSSRFLLSLQMYVVQPVLDKYQRIRASIPSWRHIQLRQKRLYKSENFYWKILAFNCVTRFTWMMCFIPSYHVSRSRTVLTSSSDVNSYWGVVLPATEIFRRTLWGFFYLEKETIKMMEADSKNSEVAAMEDEDDDMASKSGGRLFRAQLLPTWLGNQQQVAHDAATSGAKQRDEFMRHLFVIELYAWAAAFVILGCWAAS